MLLFVAVRHIAAAVAARRAAETAGFAPGRVVAGDLAHPLQKHHAALLALATGAAAAAPDTVHHSAAAASDAVVHSAAVAPYAVVRFGASIVAVAANNSAVSSTVRGGVESPLGLGLPER